MTEPRRLELAWLFGTYVRVIPTPGENGDEMAFAYNGVTYTPGELVGDSGSRTVDIELTLDGAAITSGTLGALAIFTNDVDFDGDTETMAVTYSGSPTFWLTEDNISGYMPVLIITAADGHCKTTLTITNGEAEAFNVYISIFLPTGAIDSSDAISVPGVGE